MLFFFFFAGATLSKGLNRGLGTMLAGALGVGVNYLADLSGQKGEPFVLGIFVFLIGKILFLIKILKHIPLKVLFKNKKIIKIKH